MNGEAPPGFHDPTVHLARGPAFASIHQPVGYAGPGEYQQQAPNGGHGPAPMHGYGGMVGGPQVQ